MPDRGPLSPAQVADLCAMMGNALVEIRFLAWRNHARQAGDLADALHNVPAAIRDRSQWDPVQFRQELREYQDRYPPEDSALRTDYVGLLDALLRKR